MTAILRTVHVINVTKRGTSRGMQERRVANRSKWARKKHRQKVTTGYVHVEGAEVDIFPVLNADVPGERPVSIEFEINAVNVLMEIDTGAAISIIPETVYKTLFSHLPLEGANIKLKNQHRPAHPSQRTVYGQSVLGDSDCCFATVGCKRKGPFAVWEELA